MKNIVRILTFIFWAKVVIADVQQYEINFHSTKKMLLVKVDIAIQEVDYSLNVVLKDSFAIVKQIKYQSEAVLAEVRNNVEASSVALEREIKSVIDITAVSCGVLGRYRQLALGIYDEVKVCITNHVYRILDDAEDIYNSTEKIYGSLIQTKNELEYCEDWDCLNPLMETTTVTLDSATKITVDVTEISVLVVTLSKKLEYCAAIGSTSALVSHYSEALSELPSCATQRITDTVQGTWKGFLDILNIN